MLLASTVVLRTSRLDPAYAARLSRQVGQVDGLRSPGERLLHLVTFEHRHLWADLLWLNIVQSLGRCAVEIRAGRRCRLGPADYDRVQRWAHITTDLDPKYFVAYYASAVHLTAWAKRVAGSDELLLKGRAALPGRWELPFMLGYNAYFVHGDAARAADYWLEAATLPGAPRYLPSLATRAQYQAGDDEGAIAVLEAMIPTLVGPAKTDAIIRLKMLRSEEILGLYDDACQAIRTERGVVPSADEIFQSGRVRAPPRDLLGDPIQIGPDCRARTRYIKVREDEALERIGSHAKKEAR